MRLLVTGADGFVMSSVIAQALSQRSSWDIVATDLGGGHGGGIDVVTGQAQRRVLDVATATSADWQEALEGVDVVLHGAAVSPSPAAEVSDARSFLDVNVRGTAALLEAMVNSTSRPRLVNVSSVAVYGHHQAPDGAPLKEADPVAPVDLYDVSKYAAERWVHRYRELRGLDATSVRLTRVFGRRERVTRHRPSMSLPFRIAHSIATGEPLRITAASMGAAADWLAAEDVADAVLRVVEATDPAPVYNVARGEMTPVRSLLDQASSLFPRFRCVVGSGGEGAFDLHPKSLVGKDGTFDVSLLRDSLHWTPAPIESRLESYFRWAERSPARFLN